MRPSLSVSVFLNSSSYRSLSATDTTQFTAGWNQQKVYTYSEEEHDILWFTHLPLNQRRVCSSVWDLWLYYSIYINLWQTRVYFCLGSCLGNAVANTSVSRFLQLFVVCRRAGLSKRSSWKTPVATTARRRLSRTIHVENNVAKLVRKIWRNIIMSFKAHSPAPD